jgi:hypothetical protein
MTDPRWAALAGFASDSSETDEGTAAGASESTTDR